MGGIKDQDLVDFLSEQIFMKKEIDKIFFDFLIKNLEKKTD